MLRTNNSPTTSTAAKAEMVEAMNRLAASLERMLGDQERGLEARISALEAKAAKRVAMVRR